MNNNKWF